MAICKDCKKNNWETVIGYLKTEEGNPIHLYQCRNCKRVVAGTSDDIEWNEGEI